VVAWPDEATGELHGQNGRFAELLGPLPDPAPGGAPRSISVAPGFQWVANPSGAAFGTWVVLVFLAEMAVLGLAARAGFVCLRARELDPAERELASRR
jgi:hypothetical protein